MDTLVKNVASQIKSKTNKAKSIKSAISTTAPAGTAPADAIVDLKKYAEVMADPMIFKQYCLKEKVGPKRIERILLALQNELGNMSIEDAVAKFTTTDCLSQQIAKNLNMSPSTIREELSEVVTSKNRNAVLQFINASFHKFLDIGEVCYYEGARSKFIKKVNAAAAATTTP